MSGSAAAPQGHLLQVRVVRKWVEAEGIAGFALAAADGGTLPGFEAGAHIDVHLPGTPLVRPYSLCNAPPKAGEPASHYELGVQCEPVSRGGSAAMHAQVQQGDVLTVGAPRNLFALAPQASQHLLLAGGIGITPLLAMAECLAEQGQAFALHHACRSAARAPYRQRLAAAAWSAQAHQHLDDGPADQRLDLPSLLAAPSAQAHVYVCGPQGFMDAALNAARAAGWAPEQLHWESFGGASTATVEDRAFEVQLGRGGRVIAVAADQTVLHALHAAGVNSVLSSCEQGVCGTCLTRVLDGEPDHRDQYLLPEEQAAGDQFLPCCSRSRSACLVLDL